ncbi:MAG: nicotinamide riboside transporter PnuC [Gemmatimonadota bacterium]
MSLLEVVAVTFGIVSVYLSVRENIWSWPTALVNVSLYFLIFRRERLYADMGLQVFYAGISLYGWYHWLFGGTGHSTLKVTRTPRALALTLPVLGVTAALGLGTLLARITDASVPYIDSTLTVTSLIAQWMMSRKYLENWIIWVVADVAYVGLFIYRGLLLTSFLYAVFLVLASKGYLDWRRSWERDRVVA